MHNDTSAMIINALESEQTIEQTPTNATDLVADQETIVTPANVASDNVIDVPAPPEAPAPAISSEQTNPNLLCCPNGVIDLVTGTLMPSAPEYHLTKNTNTPFSPEARFEPWEQFLDQICGANERIKNFLQLAAGYTLQGTPQEEVFFVLHGPAATGKSTFLEAFSGALGDYATNADFATFLHENQSADSEPSQDLAKLVGTRLVFASEGDYGQPLDEAMLKSMTAGNPITARRLSENAFTFRPQLKLWLEVNQLPFTAADDPAIWRRLIRIPFEHRPKELEKNLKTLFAEPEAKAAILAWAVRGAAQWFETGLVIPPEIEKANATARTEGGNPVEAPAPEAPPPKIVSEQAPTAVNRWLIGARAHFRGQLLAAFIGRLIGALRVLLFANHHTLDGTPFQIRTSSQRTFTVNPGTEPPRIIVAAKVRDCSLNGATRYALYGVLRDEALAHGHRSTSRGHVKSGHLTVALGQIDKVDLGTIVVSDELLMADDSEARRRLLQTIDSLQPDLDLDAVNAARAFLSARGDNATAPAMNAAEGEDIAPAANATATGEVPAE